MLSNGGALFAPESSAHIGIYGQTPGEFSLSANESTIQPNASFLLEWSDSEISENYSLWFEFENGGFSPYQETLTNHSFVFSNCSLEGRYRFFVNALNEFGSEMSNTIEVNVQTETDATTDENTKDKQDNDGSSEINNENEGILVWVMRYVSGGVISATTGIVIKKVHARRKQKKEKIKRSRIQKDID